MSIITIGLHSLVTYMRDYTGLWFTFLSSCSWSLYTVSVHDWLIWSLFTIHSLYLMYINNNNEIFLSLWYGLFLSMVVNWIFSCVLTKTVRNDYNPFKCKLRFFNWKKKKKQRASFVNVTRRGWKDSAGRYLERWALRFQIQWVCGAH